MNHTTVRAGVVITSLVALLTGYAVAQMAQVGSGDIVADRQRLMKLNAASARDMNDKLKAGQIEAIAVNAETIAINAQHIPVLFPAGSMTDKSNAKPEIWEKRADFEAVAKTLQAKAEEIRDAARAKDQAKVEALMKEFGRTTCGACHNTFRKPIS